MTQFTTATFSDLIENVYRRFLGGVTERTVLGSSITSSSSTVTLSGPQLTSVVPGIRLACDLEVCLVTAVSSGVATIERGWSGSNPAAHAANAVWYINPRISRFDIGVAINDEIRSLSSPSNGLYRVTNATISSYSPTFVGYDLGNVSPELIKVVQVRYKVPTPYRFYPRIKQNHYELDLNQPDTSVFPSGMALYIKSGGFPGMPVYLTYTAPFVPLVNLTDDIHNTPAVNDPAPPANGYTVTTLPNLSNTMDDLLPLGAIIRLTLGREIARNFLEAQPDARKAQEVPPGAVMSSVNGLAQERQARIQEEADRLKRKYAIPRRY